MVNKAIVGILVLIVLTSLGVGVLIGTQIGGSGDGVTDAATETTDDGAESTAADGDSSEDTNSTGNETDVAENETGTQNESGTPTPDGTSTSTATATATPTATPTPTQTTIASYEFDESTIEREIVEDVNEGRSERGLATLGTSSSTAKAVRNMVRAHSQTMAEERIVAFQTDDYANASARYKGHDLYERCKYQDSDGGFIQAPENSFQAVGKTIAGREYEDDGTTRFNRNEGMVAEAIVSDWFSSSTYSRPLTNDEVEIIGIGVTVTDDGEVYASAAICS